MNKRNIAIIAVVVVAISVAAYFLLSGIFAPPVDISGINLSQDLTPEELAPAQLVNYPLDDVHTGWHIFHATEPDEFSVYRSYGSYDGGKLLAFIFKAEDKSEASEAFELLYDSYSFGATSMTKTSDWFTTENSLKVFFWKSDRWVFGIEAENSEIRKQAATELVEELKSHS